MCPTAQCLTEGFRTVSLSSLGELCPFDVGPLPLGNREFDGHGPIVSIDVTLEVSADSSRIPANVHIEARETTSDDSTLIWDSAPLTVFATAADRLGALDRDFGSGPNTSR